MTDTTPDPGDQLTSFIESLYDGVRPPDSDDVALVYDLVHDLRERVAVAVQHGFREGASQVAHDRDDKAANEWEAGYQACYERMQAEGRLLPAAGRAAPRAEGLQPDTPASQFADRLAEALDKEWDAFLIEGEPSLNFGDYAERVAVRLSRRPSDAQGAAPRAEGLDVERLIDTSAAALILEGVRELQRNRGRLSKVTVEDMRRLLLLVVDASARLCRPSDERVPESEER